MTIHQLSIFIENKSGSLVKVLGLFRQFGLQIIASTIPDTADNGIYRVICAEPLRAYEGLKKAGIPVALSDVFAIELDDQPGRAAEAIKEISAAGVSILYLYSFLWQGKGVLVFRADQSEKAKETIMLNKLTFLTEEDFKSL